MDSGTGRVSSKYGLGLAKHRVPMISTMLSKYFVVLSMIFTSFLYSKKITYGLYQATANKDEH